MKKLFLVPILAFFALIISCDKNEVELENENIDSTNTANSINENLYVDNDGILHFESPESFNKFITNFVKLDDNQKDEWERSINFISYRFYFRQLNDQLSQSNEQNDFEKIKMQNNKYFNIKNDYIEPTIPVEFYQSIVNKDGYYYVDKILYKVNENKIYIGTNIKNIDFSKGLEYISIDQNKAADINYKEVSVDKDKRSLRATMNSYIITTFLSWPYNIDNALQRQVVEVQTRTYKKYFENWHLYRTDHHNQNIRFSVVVPKRYIAPYVFSPKNQYFNNVLYSYNRLGNEVHPNYQVWTDTYLVGDEVNNKYAVYANFYYTDYYYFTGDSGFPPYFHRYRISECNTHFRSTLTGSFSSGGVAPYWANIWENCDSYCHAIPQ